jgi:hypothetical protein
VLVRGLSIDSSLTRTLNGGRRPWGQVEHLIADLWVVLVKILNPKSRVNDHPTRAEFEAKAAAAAMHARVAELKKLFEKRKRTYGLG